MLSIYAVWEDFAFHTRYMYSLQYKIMINSLFLTILYNFDNKFQLFTVGLFSNLLQQMQGVLA